MKAATLITALLLAFAGLVRERGAAAASSTPAAPIAGKTVMVARISGKVQVRVPPSSRFQLLTAPRTVPDGAELDAKSGRVRVTVATGSGSATASAEVYGSRFVIHQTVGSPTTTHLIMTTRLTCSVSSQRKLELPGPTPFARAAARGRTRPGARPLPRVVHLPTSRRLFASEHGGNFETDSNYEATIGIGTAWETADSCYSSIVRVTAGIVRVKNLVTGITVTVSAGHSYRVARPELPGYLPRKGVYFGVTGQPVGAFTAQVGRRQAVYGAFTYWGQTPSHYIAQAGGSRSRLLLHISTSQGYGKPEVITPGAIARGDGDAYLLALSAALAQNGHPAYLALLPEMNQTNNAYSAFDASGSARDADHSTAAYKQAWRRSFLIIRGGRVAAIDAQLASLNLPPVQAPPPVFVRPVRPPRLRPYRLPRPRVTRAALTTTAVLPVPKVAFLWAPQVAGSPDVPRNSAAAYFPGLAYVDIVGTDFYSQFPNFGGLEKLYAEFPSKPFGFNEWGMWVNPSPAFAAEFFTFIRSHPRVQLVVYNQGLRANGPFRLNRFPAARKEIRRQLARSAAVDYTPDWARP